MTKHLLKTFVTVLAIAAAAANPAWGQNATTYNVTFGGFNEPAMNTTVSVTSLPQTFTAVGDYGFYPFTVISHDGSVFTSASVTSGGEGKVSVNMPTLSQMTITVTGTFEGTATIHVVGSDTYENPVSRDITVACTLPPQPHTVRFAEGMSGWQVQDVTAATSATAPAILQNVMAGDSLVVTAPATLPGKVKSVKAVKYVAPVVITWNTTNVLKEANQNDELNRSHRTPLTYEGITISFSGNDVSSFNPYSTAREYPALECHGDDGDSFTFTAPSGKKFTKIEINDNSYINFDAYGDWTKPENNKIVWRGTAANAVTLGSVFTLAGQLNSIVFTLIDAQ